MYNKILFVIWSEKIFVTPVIGTLLIWSSIFLDKIFSRLGQSQGLLYKHLCNKLTDSVIICENIFTVPPCPNGFIWCFQSYNFLEILNLEGHRNHVTVSRVTAIFLNGWTLPISWASAVEGLQSKRLPCLVLIASR